MCDLAQDIAFVEAVANLVATALDRCRADEALRARDEFVCVVAHELRAPLAAARLDLAALGRRDDAMPPPRQRALERVARCVGRLTDTLETVLDMSRLTLGRIVLHRERVDLAALIHEVVDRLARDAERVGCEVTVHVPPALDGEWDPRRLEQILVNLLSNAFRYAPGGPVEITAEADGDLVTVRVRDHGDGVAEDDAERIFQRFERADRERGVGLGVGLYVSREIAEAHGGTLELARGVDDGATFVIRLPRLPVVASAECAPY